MNRTVTMIALIVGSIVLIAIAIFAARRARIAFDEWKKGASSLPDPALDALQRAERNWRFTAHASSFFSLCPLSMVLNWELSKHSSLVPWVVGQLVAAGGISFVVKSLAGQKWSTILKPFAKEVTFANQLVVAMLGFALSVLVSLVYLVWLSKTVPTLST